MTNPATLLDARDVCKYYRVRKGRGKHVVHAVESVSFEVVEGETVGLVGESGCGKSTLGRVLVGLEPATAGTVTVAGEALSTGTPWSVRRQVQIIFQDPYGALNPRMTVGHAIAEVLSVHHARPRREIQARVSELLDQVGLTPAMGQRRPRELSGGERQRAVIARALATEPRLLIADEATSALDVSIRAQLLNLLTDLQDQLRLTYIFISHDLSVIRHISRRVMVMYLGRIVESATAEELFRMPRHPYTQGLLAAVPSVDLHSSDAPGHAIGGDVPDPTAPPPGCAFHERCPIATERCAAELPELRHVAGGGLVACHHADLGGAQQNTAPTEEVSRATVERG